MLSLILLKLSLQDVLADIPRDPEAMVTYSVLLIFVGFIWVGNRQTGRGSGADVRQSDVQ